MARAYADVLIEVKRLADEIVAEESDRSDQDAAWPEASIRALQDAGLGGLVVPDDMGGLGQGLFEVVETCELLGRKCGSTAIAMGMHHVGTAVIAAKATPDQEDRYLRPIAAGEHLTTLALSEPGTGVNFYYPETTLSKADGEFTVEGRKSFVTNGGHADSYVVSTVAADPDAPPAFFSCVLIPEGSDGMHWGPPYEGFGMRGNSARTVELDSVKLPAHDLLGEEGDQIWYVFNVVAPYFLVAMAGTYLGIADRAVEETMQHLKEREHSHSGRRLADQDVLQHKLGALWANLERTRRFVYWAAKEADAGGSMALPALCMAKAEVGTNCVDICNEAMTLVGGQAYRANGLLPRLLRDARAAHVMAPTTDILTTWAGRALLDLPLLEE